MPKRIYLAGPEVFLPCPEKLFVAKQAICQEHGFVGISPLETHADFSGLTPKEAGWRISRANEDCIRSCDLLIANLTPFRSPSADVGTAFEMGFMRALGRPVFGSIRMRRNRSLSGRTSTSRGPSDTARLATGTRTLRGCCSNRSR